MNKTRAIEGFVCIAVLIAVLFVGVWQIKPAQATTIFSDGFESGNFSAWSSQTGTPTVSTTYSHTGTYSCKINAAATDTKRNFTARDIGFELAYIYFDALSQTSGNYLGFMVLENAATGDGARAEVYHNGSHSVFALQDIQHSERLQTTVVVATGQWYCVQIECQKGVGSANGMYMWIDGVQSAGPTTNGINVQIDLARVGWHFVGGSATYYVDDVVVADAYIEVEENAYTLTINSNPISVDYSINGTALGYNVTASSGSPSDIQTAINTIVTAGGGTVYIPAGTFTFNPSTMGTVNITFTNVPINIIGAGIGVTILQETINPASITMFKRSWNGQNYNGSAVRISGISFVGHVVNETVTSNTAIDIRCTTDFRIDHCSFQDFAGIAIYTDYNTGGTYKLVDRGVIDHCSFDNPYKDYWAPHNSSNPTWTVWGYGVVVVGDGQHQVWDPDISDYLGYYYSSTTYNGFPIPEPIYIENCNFSRMRHAISSNTHGYYVSRYNYFEKCSPYGQNDVHGGVPWGGRGLESYSNIFNLTDESYSYGQDEALQPRGGGGVCWNNTVILAVGYSSPSIRFGNDGEVPPYDIEQFYIWNNTAQWSNGTAVSFNSKILPWDYVENVNYFLRQPDMSNDSFTYTPYIYPHPFTAGTFGYTNDTVSLTEGTYLVTVPASTISGGNNYNFSKWQDDSTNTTFTVSLTANTTITATYTVYVTDTSGTVGVVGVTGTYGYAAVEYAVQRKTFYANGRFWVFYFNGTISANNTVYATSTDGLSWSSSVNMTNRTCGAGWQFAVTFNGTILSYAFSTGTNGEPLYYRAGTPNSDGTITWLDAEQNVTTGESNTGHLWPTIAIDSGGYPWIAYARKNVTENTRYAYITKSSTNTGTWTTASGFPHQLSSENYTCIQVLVVPLTNQKVLAIASNAHTPIKSFQWNGSSWGTQQNTTSSIADVSIFFSAVNQGDDVHLAFVKNSTYDLVYAKYNYSSDSWGTETTIQSAVNETSSPVLSIDTSTNDLYCFWAGSPETNAIYYKRYNGTNWVFASDSNPWITETALAGYYKYDGLSGFYQTYDHKIGLAYTNGTTVYFVKFKYFNITAPEVTVTVTYPANTTYTTSTISVEIWASGGIIDTIWWNCKNGTSWIYGTNQTYTTPTSMTGFVDGASYTFYAWANNTDGNSDEETVMFTVEYEVFFGITTEWGGYWGRWWGYP